MLCACGCGNKITIKPHHKYRGSPKFIKGHNSFLRIGDKNPHWKGGVSKDEEHCKKRFKIWSDKNRNKRNESNRKWKELNPEKNSESKRKSCKKMYYEGGRKEKLLMWIKDNRPLCSARQWYKRCSGLKISNNKELVDIYIKYSQITNKLGVKV